MVILIISAFAVYGITAIISDNDGPFGLVYKLRSKLPALSCFVCTSVYVAGGVSLLVTGNLSTWFIYTFGLSGIAMLLNTIVNHLW